MKNVLIVVYPWPPAGGPGVQRCLKFAKFLPEFGWNPIVLTVEEPEVSAIDESLLGHDHDIEVHRTKKLEPYNLYRFFTGKKRKEAIPVGQLKNVSNPRISERVSSWIRTNLFIPDAKVGWKPYAVAEGKRILRSRDISAVLSSGPPHTAHLIARKLALKFNLPWIADFRDPWTDIDYYDKLNRSAFAAKRDRRLESECLQAASALTTVSAGLVRLFASKPHAPSCRLIPNGFDRDDLPEPSPRSSGPFTIYYGGSMSLDRIPHALIHALGAFKKQRPEIDFHFNLAGSACAEFKEAIDDAGLDANYRELGYLPHREAARRMSEADLLLLSINRVRNNRGIVTGKIFEYMGIRIPILGIGPVDGDAARLLSETDSGRMFDYEDSDEVFEYLLRAILETDDFRNRFAFDVDRYSRRNLTSTLGALLDEVTA